MLRINIRIVVQSVEEDKTVSKKESLIFFLEVLRVLFLVSNAELLDNSLDLITFSG